MHHECVNRCVSTVEEAVQQTAKTVDWIRAGHFCASAGAPVINVGSMSPLMCPLLSTWMVALRAEFDQYLGAPVPIEQVNQSRWFWPTFGHRGYPRHVLHCIKRKFGYSKNDGTFLL